MPTKVLRSTASARPIHVVDPATKTQYVLVRADVFEQMCGAAEEFDPRETYPFIDAVMREDDARDSVLAGYEHYRSAAKAAIFVDELQLNTFGTKLQAKKSKDPWPLLIRGRLQVIRAATPAEGFFLCLRATSGYTTSKLEIPVLKLGDVSVQADLGGLVQEAFLNVMNSDFLLPHRPLPLVPAANPGDPLGMRLADLSAR